jgi:hypothetical protein
MPLALIDRAALWEPVFSRLIGQFIISQGVAML